jgi:hypothetical protein
VGGSAPRRATAGRRDHQRPHRPTGARRRHLQLLDNVFNAALRYGLEMGAQRNHYYPSRAIRWDSTPPSSRARAAQSDDSFRNDTPNPILIHGINAYGLVTFELWSVDVGRKVSFSPPIVKNVRPARDTTEYTETLPAGTTKRIESPADGKDVWVTRTVRDAFGNIVHQETYYSHYARVDGVTLVGQGSTPPEARRPPSVPLQPGDHRRWPRSEPGFAVAVQAAPQDQDSWRKEVHRHASHT